MIIPPFPRIIADKSKKKKKNSVENTKEIIHGITRNKSYVGLYGIDGSKEYEYL